MNEKLNRYTENRKRLERARMLMELEKYLQCFPDENFCLKMRLLVATEMEFWTYVGQAFGLAKGDVKVLPEVQFSPAALFILPILWAATPPENAVPYVKDGDDTPENRENRSTFNICRNLLNVIVAAEFFPEDTQKSFGGSFALEVRRVYEGTGYIYPPGHYDHDRVNPVIEICKSGGLSALRAAAMSNHSRLYGYFYNLPVCEWMRVLQHCAKLKDRHKFEGANNADAWMQAYGQSMIYRHGKPKSEEANVHAEL